MKLRLYVIQRVAAEPISVILSQGQIDSFFNTAKGTNFKTLVGHSSFFSLRKPTYNVTDFPVLPNPGETQKISFMGLCGRNICPKVYA